MDRGILHSIRMTEPQSDETHNCVDLKCKPNLAVMQIVCREYGLTADDSPWEMMQTTPQITSLIHLRQMIVWKLHRRGWLHEAVWSSPKGAVSSEHPWN